MISKLLRRVFSKQIFPSGAPLVIPRKQHGITRSQISSGALKTAAALRDKGYTAFVVGGAVRDLLLGLKPKDFDVATDATPEQVRTVFRRARIIGRRFRLVHVMHGAETVEVSTFRGTQSEGSGAEQDEHGRILRDNVFGTRQQDAERRDFTVNALFYDPQNEEVLDYVGGFADLQARRLRIIGDAVSRYREDPMRMLRAVRFAAKLGFKIEPSTRAPILKLAPLLQNVPASRLFEEMLKLLLSGHAAASVKALRENGLHQGLLSMLDLIIEQPLGQRFFAAALKNTDDRIREDKPVSPGFLFAALLWHEVLAAWKNFESRGVQPMLALHQAMEQVISRQAQRLAIPRRFTATMKEIWTSQPRFLQRAGKRPFRLIEHPCFRAGYDFLLLRCDSGEVDAEIGKWWTAFQNAGQEQRRNMLMIDQMPGKRRRRRRRKGPAQSQDEGVRGPDQPAAPVTE
ncbi:MAG TPA: polynucleotide adenylyltransferase PcnB [Burkholderiales bacterium]|nr:polynucleotide adenylyltransferase PcnB [Burkholderiales bacterium]